MEKPEEKKPAINCRFRFLTFVVRAVFHVPRQAEVAQLDAVDRRHQHVPRRNVPEDGEMERKL